MIYSEKDHQRDVRFADSLISASSGHGKTGTERDHREGQCDDSKYSTAVVFWPGLAPGIVWLSQLTGATCS